MLNASFLCLAAALLAGVASTLLELSWLRTAAAVLPGTVPAAAVVVPAFFAAWTAGSAVGGRLMDRTPSRLGLAARWLGASALAVVAVPWLATGLEPDGVPVGWATRLLVGGLPVVPAAFGLGGALPLLARLRSAAGCAPERATGGVAMAVALGGALGCGSWVGLMTSGPSPALVAGLGLAVGALICWLLGWAQRGGLVLAGERLDAAPAPTPAAHGPPPRAGAWLLVVAAAVGGLLLVGGQLAVLRLSAQLHGDSVQTTAEILGGVHLGMALGAGLLWFSWRILATPALVGSMLVMAGLGLLAPVLSMAWLSSRSGWEAALWLAVPLGLAAGSIVTAASRADARPSGRLGAWVGDLAAWSTLGGVAGSLLYGALLADPEVGTGGWLRALWLAAPVVGLAVAASALRGRHPPAARTWATSLVLVGGAATLALGFATPAIEMPWQLDASESLVEQHEGPYGVVSLVTTTEGALRLKLDNRFGLGGSSGVLLEQRMGRVAAAMRPGAERTLMLGLGRGHTLAGLATASRSQVDCVERNAQVLALGLDVPFLTDPPAGEPARHHADARAWIDDHEGGYDLIVGDLFFPWVTGAGELLTLEHFEAVSRGLTTDGVFVQWLPLHQLPWSGFGAVVNAFVEVFPTARLMLATPLANEPIVALVGGLDDGLPDPGGLDALLQSYPSPVGPHVAGDVYDLYVTDAWSLSTRFRDAVTNRRRQPVSELVSLRRQDDEAFLARTNTRLLADMVSALDTSSLTRTPSDQRANRQLGKELQARSTVLRHLLLARSDEAALQALLAEARAEGRSVWSDERRRLEENLTVNLLSAWSVYPGQVNVRAALLERSQLLARARRWDDAGNLLKAAVEIRGDASLGGLLGGVLVQLGLAPDAVVVLEQSRRLAPDDRTVLANLSFALLASERDDAAREVLNETRLAFAPGPLPPTHAAALALIERQPGGEAAARQLLGALEPDSRWTSCLRRLLGEESG